MVGCQWVAPEVRACLGMVAGFTVTGPVKCHSYNTITHFKVRRTGTWARALRNKINVLPISPMGMLACE
jgi:hypothetical protein